MESRSSICTETGSLKLNENLLSNLALQLEKRGFQGQIKIKEPLKSYTTWKIGGPGDIVVFPEKVEDLTAAICFAKDKKLPVTVLGNGSNVLIKDGGIRGIIIITTRLQEVTINSTTLIAGSGVKLPKLARVAANNSLAGLEFTAGIPGTLGGAVVMNAGAHGGSIGNLVTKVVAIDTDCNKKTYHNQEMMFGYRSSILKKSSEVVAEVELQLRPGNKDELLNIMKEHLRARKGKQPLEYPNAGSVFKNPSEFAAGYLIEKSGGKEMRCGAARVSSKHANFIVNLGGAKAREVLELIEEVRNRVYKKFGITLELEVEILGED
ncbi:MAG: murB [Clostridiales bacterium]|jgi:UDP-N-acetylmuramate dehydrogenase|nr:murB [Clostridiales bacterium]